MLALTHLHGFNRRRPVYILDVIKSLGLTTNLKLCLDAADPRSYSGGSQWIDISGQAYDFNFGDNVTGTTFPTFTGGVGNDVAHFAFDGGDYFTGETTNPAWVQTLHKDNAVFTVIAGGFHVTTAQPIFGTNGTNTTSGTGLNVHIGSSENLALRVRNAGAAVNTTTSSIATSVSGNFFAGLSLTEATGAGGLIFHLNGTSETASSTYTSPAAGDATQTIQLGSVGTSGLVMESGSKLHFLAIWDTALTADNLASLWQLTRRRLQL